MKMMHMPLALAAIMLALLSGCGGGVDTSGSSGFGMPGGGGGGGFGGGGGIPTGTMSVTTIAGSPSFYGSTDAVGTAARFSDPFGIATDGTNVYVADVLNANIRKIVTSSRLVSTVAGSAGAAPGYLDAIGTNALFHDPMGVATDGTSIFVTDSSNHVIRQILISSGSVSTLAGTAGAFGTADGIGSVARFYYPRGITTDGTNLYVTDEVNDTIRKIVIATGDVSTLAGSPGSTISTDGTGTAATFFSPNGITTDGTNLYVTENETVRKIVIASGIVTTLAGSPTVTGSADGTGSAARFNHPEGIATDGVNVYVADQGNHTIRKIVIATGVVTTVAGSAGSTGSTDGPGTSARFNKPSGITRVGIAYYITDTLNGTIRRLN